MKMRFDPAARNVDQKRRHQHLTRSHNMPCQCMGGVEPSQSDGHHGYDPPRIMDAQTCICTELAVPLQVRGETMAAVSITPAHCKSMSTTNMLLVFRAMRSRCSWTSSPMLVRFSC